MDLLADYPFALKITIEGLLAEAPLTSPTHRINTTREGTTVIVTLANCAYLDRDFVLSAGLGAFKGAAVTARDGDGYVSLVSWVPALPTPKTAPLALKVLIDCSGSMAGDSIAQARRALAAIVERIETPGNNSGGCIGLTRFGSSVVKETNGLQRVTPDLVSKLRVVATNLQADLGGTELPGALRAVVSQPTNGAANPAVLLVTDGEIWAVDQALAAVADAGHRLFVVAVGAAPNEALARRVAEVTGGACEFVAPGEDIEQPIVRMARRVREPAYCLSEVRWPVEPEWTAPLPAAVFSGDTVHLFAGFSAQPSSVAIATVADGNGEVVTMQPIALSSILSNGDTLARVAAARRLAGLEEDEAAALAERHQLASKYTAFVVVDVREAKAAELPQLAAVPQMLAAGWGGAGSVVTVEECLDFHMPRLAPPVCYDLASEGQSVGRSPRRRFAFLRPARDAGAPSTKSPTADRPRAGVAKQSPAPRRDALPILKQPASPAMPLAVAERMLAEICSTGPVPRTTDDLGNLGVPRDLRDDLQVAAELRGFGEHIVVQLWIALLLDHLREWLADPKLLAAKPAQEFMAILGDRSMRDLRRSLVRRVRTYSVDSWS